ncbi:cyclically-permuted mutarotase family protein [Fusobacterium canifelinum]|uniref:Cyclically-permuted mutarotase family protein n=1 Tax=Fusobacterium canifelinum TaxID=285729 RepID=A0A3P1URQ2_9FUSO|nr:cyclically-permuted mutarotase family protein [Fusobacterium canifelinum]
MVFLSSFGYASQKTLSIENNRLVWDYAGSLPAQKGFDKNIGTAGLLQGIIEDYIVVGGGANFPEALEKGGKKVTHKDLYLLKDVNGKLKTIEQIQLDYPIAYGASVSVKEENAIYYLGGSPDSEHMRDILKVTLKNGKLKTEIYAKLPLGFENGVAQYKDGKIYYGVGKIENSEGKNVNSNKFYVFDLKTKETKELAEFPGEARQQTVGQILNNKFYVFSGGSNISYVDGYAYDFKTDTWKKVADVVVDNEKILLLGANSIKISENKMLVIGGFDYKLWNDANYNLSNLKDDKLKDYKADYFGAEPQSYKWNRKILIFDATKNSWKSIGEVPFDAPCGAALLLMNNNIYSINGEIKPGVRTERMYKAYIISK